MRALAMAAMVALTGLGGLASDAALAQTAKLVTDEWTVGSTDPRIRIYIRNTHPSDMKAFRADRTVLFIHGETYPAEATFDLKLGGVSWMDYVAGRGFDVYMVDIRGYGRSGRPREMTENSAVHPPLVGGAAALDDIAVAVEAVVARRRITKLSLIGQSWGATLAAAYAAQNPTRIERLALYAPYWIGHEPATSGTTSSIPFGAYRLVTREEVREQRFRGVPESKRGDLFPAGWFEAFQDAAWASDPFGVQSGQPILRAPNGAFQDLAEMAGGKPLFDPAKIKAPALLTVGEWDVDTPPYMAQGLLSLMVNAPGRRAVILPEGTHDIFMERSRNALLRAVQIFLEEAKP
jgi:pimeloyl-ACP methyl ester carboxylesterase